VSRIFVPVGLVNLLYFSHFFLMLACGNHCPLLIVRAIVHFSESGVVIVLQSMHSIPTSLKPGHGFQSINTRDNSFLH
jgi:hypothetical protein